LNDEGILNLRDAIIIQAVKDWRQLYTKQKQKKRVNFNLLRKFFKSEWCMLLTMGKNEIILEQLEKERKTIKRINNKEDY